MWVDVHAHLYGWPEDQWDQMCYRARQHDVGIVVNTATALNNAKEVIAQATAANHAGIAMYAAAGISPFDCENLAPQWLDSLRMHCTCPEVIAVGEIGLDDSNPRYPCLDCQIPVFEQQLALAHELNKPVIMHSRGAELKVLSLCKNMQISRAVFHCFTGEKTILRQILDYGYFVSFAGMITFKNNPYQECVSYTPLEQLFIETDTPYLAPQPYRGKTNEPGYIYRTGETVARLKQISAAQTAEQIMKNFNALFLRREPG